MRLSVHTDDGPRVLMALDVLRAGVTIDELAKGHQLSESHLVAQTLVWPFECALRGDHHA